MFPKDRYYHPLPDDLFTLSQTCNINKYWAEITPYNSMELHALDTWPLLQTA